ncbi:head GIN domain-containing protein [Yeosuana marina]|uniref:head GIN domain-containing protein n=1 Tax=Yeosuana marina TaxID=1565536 RepID=UPI0030EF40F2|tara:strand:+ start:584 stop:1318 length:735 start_codon:yes stop_codon:yes gene_type:complete
MKTSFKNQTVLFIACLFFATTTYAQWGKTIRGNGNITTITRTTSDYDGIKCAGSFDYILVSGNEGNIKIEGEENLLQYIVTEVKGNNLIVKVKDHVNLKTSMRKTIKITIPFKDISKISLAGSGDLWNNDLITCDNLDVSLAGSGDVILHVNASNIKGSVAGSGDLTFKGNTNSLEAKVAGSGDFHSFELQSKNTDISVAGSGDAEVTSTDSIKARVSGSGDIVYKGHPKKEDTKVAGSGSISS